MKKSILLIILLSVFISTNAQEEFKCEKIAKQVSALVAQQKYVEAEKLLVNNRTKFAQDELCNFYYQQIYSILLYGREEYKQCIPYLIAVVDILDKNPEILNVQEEYYGSYYMLAHASYVVAQTNAKEYILKAKNIYEKGNKEHLSSYSYILTLINNIEVLSIKKGDQLYQQGIKYINQPTKAISFLEQAAEIYAANLNKDSDSILIKHYEITCINIGNLYDEIGNIKKAEEYYLIAEQSLQYDKNNPMYRIVLTSLGTICHELHNYNKAEIYYEEAKLLYEENNDVASIGYAGCLSNFANTCYVTGSLLMAKMYIDVAEKIYIANEDVSNQELASTYNTMTSIYEDLKLFNNAIEYSNQALKYSTKKDATYAFILNNIGYSYLQMQDYKDATNYFSHAYKLNSDLNYGRNLLHSYFLENDVKTIDIAKEISEQEIKQTTENFQFLPQSEREIFWNIEQIYFMWYNGFAYHFRTPEACKITYNNALFSKGLLLRTSNSIRDAIYASNDTLAIQKYQELVSIRTDLAKQEMDETGTNSLNKQADEIDKFLTKRVAAYGKLKKENPYDWKKVQSSLAKNEMAVEFISVPVLSQNDVGNIDSTVYCALILKKGMKAPLMVPLFEKKELQGILNKLDLTKANDINKLYKSRGFNEGNKLYHLIWKPLEEYLKGITHIYYSPIGQLNFIAFDAIPKNDTLIGDKYALHLVSSTLQIAQLKKMHQEKPSKATVYGGILYDINEETLLAEARSYTRGETEIWHIEDTTTRSDWKYLPGTKKEADAITANLSNAGVKTQYFSDSSANEESFKALDGTRPEMIHIATHGFFLSDIQQAKKNPFIRNKMTKDEELPNPLLRSGLMFAGGNHVWTDETPIPGIEDGILTADEISRLDLTGTHVVVLSACETGLGETANAEGVFGLQRAFKLAGVESLIMSLWRVPDDATRMLMTSFYSKWLSGESRHNAFKEAIKEVRLQYPDPYHWAAFVLLD